MNTPDTPLGVGDWPNALYDDRRFVVWRFETRHGKLTKPPYIPGLGALARNDDPSTWRSHAEALAILEKGTVDGFGYMLLGRQGLGACDLDDCLRDGVAAPWAAQLVMRCGSYCEITPSGKGLRILGIARSDLPDMHFKLLRPDGGSLEVYHRAKRYITLSLKPFGDELPFADISEVLDDLYKEKTYGNGAGGNNGAAGDSNRNFGPQAAADLSALPSPIVGLITLGAPHGADRSREFYRVIAHLRTRGGWIRGEIESVLRSHPQGIAARCFEAGKDDVSRHVRMALDRIDDETARQKHAKVRSAANDDDESVEPYQLTGWNPWQKSGGPEFPLQTLPGLAQEWVATRAMQTGADISAFAMAFLHIVSGCVDHRLCLQPKLRETAFHIRPNLWSMLIGPSSTLKSAVVSAVTSCLRRFDKQDANSRAASVNHAVVAGTKREEAEKNEPPSRRRLLVDATIERISEILSYQDCGATLVRDELSGWLNNMDRYGHGSDRPFWLEAKNGGYFVVDRVRGTREVNVLSISLFGGIQPERLRDLGSLTEDGLFQRFSPVNMRAAGDECDEDATPDLSRHFDNLVTDIGRIPPQILVIDEDAAAAYVAFSNFMRRTSSISIPNEAYGSFIGKQARTMAAIALLLHIVDLSRSFDVHYSPLPLATLQRAQQIVETFILPHAELFYSTVVSDSFSKTQSIAGALIRLADEGTVETTSRELGRRSGAIRELQSDHAKIRSMLTPFVINGWLTPREMLPNNIHWTINPALAGKFQTELKNQQEILLEMKKHMGGV